MASVLVMSSFSVASVFRAFNQPIGIRSRQEVAAVLEEFALIKPAGCNNFRPAAQSSAIMKKQIRLNAFAMNCVAHQSPGLWTHPRDRTAEYNRLPYWIHLA